MVENDAVNCTAYVRIYKDPTGVLWHNFVKLVFNHCLKDVAEAWVVTIRNNRLAWLDSRTRGQHVILTLYSNHCTSPTHSARYHNLLQDSMTITEMS